VSAPARKKWNAIDQLSAVWTGRRRKIAFSG